VWPFWLSAGSGLYLTELLLYPTCRAHPFLAKEKNFSPGLFRKRMGRNLGLSMENPEGIF
jgi:hypothetical protein